MPYMYVMYDHHWSVKDYALISDQPGGLTPENPRAY